MYQLKYFKVCRLRCKRCGSVMEYHNRAKDDLGTRYPMMCSCGKVGLDPSACDYRILGNPEDWEDLSEEWTDEECDDRLFAIATQRIEGADPASFIPAERLYEDMGITQDVLDAIEDVDIE